MNWVLLKLKKQTDSKQLLIALCSGVLMGLSPAPLNLWLLSWIALAPLWITIFSSKKSLKNTALLGFVWGCGYHGLALFWITGVHPMTWMGVPWLASLAIAIAVWLIISFWGALLVTLWAIIFEFICNYCHLRNQSNLVYKAVLKVLIGVTIWCCLETLWSYGSLWWSSLSYTQSPHNLAILQLSKLSGFSTITAAVVGEDGITAEIILSFSQISRYRDRAIALFLPVAVFLSLHLWGFLLYSLPFTEQDLQPLKIGIIQGNIPNEIKLYSEGWTKAIRGYTTGYQRLAKQVDAVLTPEGALPFYWDNLLDNSDFYRAVVQSKVTAWVGAYGRAENSYTNSLFTLTGEGKTYSRYDKTILVPLGEYIPFEPIIGKLIDRLSPLEARLQAGKPYQIFDTPFGRASVGICYESAFSQHLRYQTARGGEFMLTASNNAHYSTTMPAQHHAQDVIRAIENDRWMARATNTGYSAIVDPRGNTIWRSQINEYQIHADTIYRRKTKTLYVRWGNWLTVMLLVISICSIVSDRFSATNS